MMEDIIAEIVEGWNPVWTQKYSARLLRQDVSLRLRNNKEPLPNSAYGTLADFYRAHTVGQGKDVYVGKAPKSNGIQIKGPFIPIELFIDKDMYIERVDGSEGNTNISSARTKITGSTSRKRAAYDGMPPPDVIPNKRGRVVGASGGIPKSSFNGLSKASAAVDSVTSVQLTLATVIIDDTTGEIDVTWPEGQLTSQMQAQIGTVKMDSGQTKNVYKLIMDGKVFVAKRFFNVGNGPNNVQPSENYQNLHQEIWRAKLGQWFLDRFYAQAELKAVEVDKDLCFTETHFAREVPSNNGGYSIASGIDADVIASDIEPEKAGAYWLIEPRRPRVVRKWTGTLNHSDRNLQGLLGMTISAFSHFVFEDSGYGVVIADIQTTTAIVGNHIKAYNVIFDVMTHTPDGDSGVGDHGQGGINAFLAQHTCNTKCENLGLAQTATVRRKVKRVSGADGSDGRGGGDADSDSDNIDEDIDLEEGELA
ncbi:kinase-like domain-containing protein [Amylostereum chailletii]|nr:kinase-like domain-containing protein [Amylostereum chailletii]